MNFDNDFFESYNDIDEDIFDEDSTESNDFSKVNNTNDNSKISILDLYAENLTKKNYITNPAIERDEELKKMILILLSPEKSVVLTGHAGVGKTALVEGLSYKIINNDIPNVLRNCTVYKIGTSPLLGNYEHDGIEEAKLQLLINEISNKKDIILFIDEIHTLVTSAKNGSGIDFLNMLKPVLDRGDIKIIGATTTQEYEEYLLKDKAFLRRFEKVEIPEPTQEMTVKILMGTKKKIEKNTGVIFPYSDYTLEQVCKFIVDLTSEYKRVYENGSRYPDVSLSLFSKCFTFARYDNSKILSFKYIYEAIKNTTLVYDDVIKKAMPIFKETFKEWIEKENVIVE